MHKRIILFILGLVVAIGVFWLYQAVTGSSMLFGTKKNPPRIVGNIEKNRPISVERRHPDGSLEYVLNAKKADPAKNEKGEIIQGQYILTDPSASYYAGEQLIIIRADSGTLSIDQLGTAAKPKLVPRGGKLSGNVILTIGPKDSFTNNSLDLKPGQIQARLEKDIEFDYNDRILTSEGAIQVRGDRLAFDGKKLTLAFNMDERRIEFLRIEEGNKIILKNIGTEAFGLQPKAPSNSPPNPLDSPTATSTSPAIAATNPANPSTTYKLSFGQEVKATVGTRSLTSDRLYVLFMIANSQVTDTTTKPAKPVTSTPTATAPVPTPTTQTASTPASTQVVLPPVTPFPKESENDLVVTWTGPMEMRPSASTDLVLKGNRDAALEAVGSPERPVILHDNSNNAERTATAGRMWFHAAEQRLELEKGNLPSVTFGDPTIGKAICMGITLLQTGEGKYSAKLVGPGALEVLQSAIRRGGSPASIEAAKKLPPLVARWGKDFSLDLLSVKDAKGRSSPIVRQGIMTGDASVADSTFSLAAQDLNFLVAPTGDAKNPAAFEKLLATGNVQVRTARNGSSLDEKDKPDGLSAKTLELLTTQTPGTKGPVISGMLATGDVIAWSYTEDKAGKNLKRQQITTPRLDVALASRDGSAAPTAPDNFGSTQVRQMIASEGVKVELDGFGPQPVTVTAQTLTADPKDGKAVLEGMMQPNGILKPARLQQGENQIAGAKLILDQKNQSLDIPGDGSFIFVQPGQKGGEAGTPVQVTWTKAMSYNGKDMLASFSGAVKAELMGKQDQYSQLTCDEFLTVKLAQEKSDTPAADSIASAKVRLAEIVAKGNVKAEGASLDANKKPITRVFMQAPKLVYTELTKTMEIPAAGSLLVEDYRVDPKQRPEGKGKTAFAWTGSLTFVGSSGEITFKKDVRMVHIPAKPFKTTAPGGTESKPKDDKPENQRIDLNCDTLTAIMVQSKDAGGGNTIASPVALGSGGNQKISKVTALGGSVLTMGDNELSAAILVYDALDNKAIASGKDGSWATFSTGGKVDGRGEADQIIWDMAKDNAITLIRPRGNVSTPN